MPTNIRSRFERIKPWLKKIGMVGFLFFLIKGLVWLVIIYFFVKK